MTRMDAQLVAAMLARHDNNSPIDLDGYDHDGARTWEYDQYRLVIDHEQGDRVVGSLYDNRDGDGDPVCLVMLAVTVIPTEPHPDTQPPASCTATPSLDAVFADGGLS